MEQNQHAAAGPDTAGGIFRVAVAALIWGAAYPLTKDVLDLVPPITLGFLRFLIATIILLAATRSLPLQGVLREDRRTMFSLGFWGIFVLILGMNYGLKWAPGIAASLISGTPPLFTVFLAKAYLKEPILPRHVAAIVLAIPGGLLLAGDPELVTGSLWLALAGSALVTIPQFSWAMYGVMGKGIVSRYSWPLICRDTFFFGTLLLFPAAAIECGLQGIGIWNAKAIGVLLYLGIANSVITYSLWNSALARIPVSTASFVLYLQPISGAILSAYLFNERLGWVGMSGAMLLFGALFLVIRK